MNSSGKSSRSTSFVDRMGNVTVSASDLPGNRTSYKLDAECTICQTSAWSIFSPKKYCKFCYRCVCKDCSQHRVFHPERKKLHRCCSACFSRFISQGIIENFQKEISVKDDMIKQASSLLEEEKDRRSVQETTLNGLKMAISRLSDEIIEEEQSAKAAIRHEDEVIAKLEADLSKLFAVLPPKREQLTQARARLAKQKKKYAQEASEAQKQREALEDLKSRLSSNQDEYRRLQRMQEDRKVGSDPQKLRQSRKGKPADLQAVSEELKAQVATLTKENTELESQIQQLQKPKSQEREMAGIGALTDNPVLGQYLELQGEVEKLKAELSTLQNKSNPEVVEVEGEQLRRSLCKLQEENDDIVSQMERYQQSTADRRKKKCTVW